MFPEKVAERQYYQETTQDYRLVMTKFDALDNSSTTQRSHGSNQAEFGRHQHVRFSFSKIIFIVLSIIGIIMVSGQIHNARFNYSLSSCMQPTHEFNKWLYLELVVQLVLLEVTRVES